MPPLKRARLVGEVLATYQRARRLMRNTDLATALGELRAHEPSGGPEPADSLFVAARLGRAVTLVLARLPTDKRCLIRSLVLSSMLARRQIPASLVLGVRPDASEPFLAHAWVEHEGIPVTHDQGYNRLHEL